MRPYVIPMPQDDPHTYTVIAPIVTAMPSRHWKEKLRTPWCKCLSGYVISLFFFVLVFVTLCAPTDDSGAVDKIKTKKGSKTINIPIFKGTFKATHDEPKAGTAHMFVLLDRTGSMGGIAGAVKEGFDGFVREQAAKPGKMVLTLAQFDATDPFELVHDAIDVREVPPLRFAPRSATPLYDAMARMIAHAEARQHGKDEEDMTIVVFTDGLENASTEHTRESVGRLVEQKKEQGWTCVFLGANQDSYAASGAVGVARGSTSNFEASAAGARAAWSDVGAAYVSRRKSVVMGHRTTKAAAAAFLDASPRSAEAQMAAASKKAF